MINCIPSGEKNVISDMNKLSGIVEVNGVLGKYDIFAKIAGDSPGDIDLIISKIRSIKGVTSSYTMAAVYGQGGTVDKESDDGISSIL
ncbi:MAG: Lrp/AsnC ligand binding domain-containing protein [Nitrosopumilaceae archaeon]